MTGPADDLTDPQRRAMRIEIAVVLLVTFGLSAYTALLRLTESVLLGLAGQTVALNPRRSMYDLIDLGLNLVAVFQLMGWGALAVYLLWRSGFGPARIGLGRLRWRPDLLGGLGLAALIGLPGIGLYLAARGLGLSAEVQPAELYDTWWRIPVLLAVAFANGWAEEIVVVGFLLTRLRQLRIAPAVAVLSSSLLRGAYHLYQGFSAGLGNVVMGLIFGYVYLRTGRLWPLIIAHAVIDAVAFVGYALIADQLTWLG
ncbi:CPBP family intramembrane glutamic endopeptidase [Mycolicibacterium thermoresistibile]